MAKQHTKGNGVETTNGDIPVVAPMNMGKGLNWNEETGQYDVAVADNQPIVINPDTGELELRVSNLEDNMLKIRDGKLYMGNKADNRLENLYVDAINGVDADPLTVDGAGTRAKPLRTFAYALSLGEAGSTRYIRLMEDQDHYIYAQHAVRVRRGNVYITSYGVTTDYLFKNVHNGNTFLVANSLIEQRAEPRIVFSGVNKIPYRDSLTEFDRMEFTCIEPAANCNFDFSGVRLVNDLGFNFIADVRKGDERSSMTKAARIYTHESYTVNLINVRLATIGTPNVTGDVGSTDNLQYENVTKKDPRNLYRISFFYGIFVGLQLRLVSGLEDTDCYVFGNHGWVSIYGANVNISHSHGVNFTELTKRIFNVQTETLPSGDKRVLAPTTNIETRYWV